MRSFWATGASFPSVIVKIGTDDATILNLNLHDRSVECSKVERVVLVHAIQGVDWKFAAEHAIGLGDGLADE